MASIWDMLSDHLARGGQGIQSLWQNYAAPVVNPVATQFFSTLTAPETVSPLIGGALGGLIGSSLSPRHSRAVGTARGFGIGSDIFERPFALKEALLQEQLRQGLLTTTPPTPGATPQTTLYGTPFYGVGTIRQRYPGQALPPFHGGNFQQYGEELPQRNQGGTLLHPYTPPTQPSWEETEAARLRGELPATAQNLAVLEQRESEQAETQRRHRESLQTVLNIIGGKEGGNSLEAGGAPNVWRRRIGIDPATGELQFSMQEAPYSVKAFKPGYRMVGPNGEDLGVVPGGAGEGAETAGDRALRAARIKTLGELIKDLNTKEKDLSDPAQKDALEQQKALYQNEIFGLLGIPPQAYAPGQYPKEQIDKATATAVDHYVQGTLTPEFIDLWTSQQATIAGKPELKEHLSTQLLKDLRKFNEQKILFRQYLEKRYPDGDIPYGDRQAILTPPVPDPLDKINKMALDEFDQAHGYWGSWGGHKLTPQGPEPQFYRAPVEEPGSQFFRR